MVYLKLVLTAFFWGGTFIATKQVGQEIGPITGSFLRYLIASIFFVALLLHRKNNIPRLTYKQWIGVIILAATGIAIYNIAFFKGLNLIEASRASVIIAINPICIALLSSLFFKEHLNQRKLIGILISVTGAMFVVARGDFSVLFASGMGNGELYILLCVLSFAVYSLVGKKMLQGLSPLVVTAYACMFGMIFLLIFSSLYEDIGLVFNISFNAWLGLFYLGFFGTVLGLVWFYDGIKQIGASKAGLFINIVPISALLLSHFVLGEVIRPVLIVGVVLVLLGVLIVTTQRRA